MYHIIPDYTWLKTQTMLEWKWLDRHDLLIKCFNGNNLANGCYDIIYVILFASGDISGERMLDLVDDLDGQLGAERNDEFRALLITIITDDVQPGQRLDVGERNFS